MLALLHPAEKLRRRAGVVLALLGTAAILWATVRHGDPATLQPTGVLCLVCGASGGIDVWRNVVLFLPLGLGLGLAGVRPSRAALAGLALSLAVETTQATLLVGRAPSLSDLLTNTTGTLLGALAVPHWTLLVFPGRAASRRLAAAGIAVVAVALALTGAGLAWARQPLPLRLNELPPREGTLRGFEGRVHERTLDGVPVTTGWRTEPVVPAGDGDTLVVRARVTPSYEPGRLRPIVWAMGGDWREVLVVGQRHGSLVVRLRTRSADFRFASPTWSLPDAFAAGARPVALEARITGRAVTLRSDGPDGVRERRLDRRASLGWMLLAPSGTDPRWPALLTAAWLAGLVFPASYWAARAGATGSGAGRATLVAATCIAATVLLVTAAFALAAPSAGDWAGIAAGAVAGWGLAAAAGRVERAAAADASRRLAA